MSARTRNQCGANTDSGRTWRGVSCNKQRNERWLSSSLLSMREHRSDRSRASRTINLGPKVIYTQQCDISCWFDARRAERFFSAHCITTIFLARAIMLRELPLITLRINLRGALFFLAINSLVSRPRAFGSARLFFSSRSPRNNRSRLQTINSWTWIYAKVNSFFRASLCKRENTARETATLCSGR